VRLMSNTGSSQARWIGVIVFLLTVSLGEFAALILNYQNNFYLRQYISDNLSATVLTTAGLIVFAAGAAYLVSRSLEWPRAQDLPFRYSRELVRLLVEDTS